MVSEAVVLKLCGIFGIILREGKVAPIIHSALKMLEYRGYDSCGIAVCNYSIEVYKDAVRVETLKKETKSCRALEETESS